MDIKVAATAMRPFCEQMKVRTGIVFGGNATSIEHLFEMIEAIESGEVSGEKAHRWLGWIQGVVCCRGNATLEELKSINFAA